MQKTLALAALVAVAHAAPQGVTASISPPGSPPPGFSTTYSGSFQIFPANITVVHTKRDVEKVREHTLLRPTLLSHYLISPLTYQQRAACPTDMPAEVLTLTNGKLMNQEGGTGYIAKNDQFQFDFTPQAGAIYTSGFSIGSNGSLAIGSSAVFYECLSGTFNNLYDISVASYCKPILIQVTPCGGGSSGAVTQASDQQPAASGAVSQISDQQPQASSAAVITQITDQQPQAPTGMISQITDQQPQAPTSIAVITQITDQQPQAPTSAAVITQISDQQPQAPTSAAVISQISDQQPQAPTSAAVISQITDQQPQAPTSAAVITQISDQQPQAPTSAAVISQISDQQPQAPTNLSTITTPTAPPAAVTASGGNALTFGSSLLAIVVALFAALL